MRALCVADIHAEEVVLSKLLQKIDELKPDLLIVLGDITHRGPLSFAQDFLDAVEGHSKLVCLFGNMDTKEVAKLLRERGVSAHERRIRVGGFYFVGFGGGPQSSFKTPMEFTEERIYGGLSGLEIDEKTIFLTHAPPKGIPLSVTDGGVDIGSSSIRRIIEEKKPFIHLCAHVHEREGRTMLGRTLVVKVGAANIGRAAFLQLSDNPKIRFLKL